MGLPSTVFLRVTGEAFERRLRDAALREVISKIETDSDDIRVAADDLAEVRDALVRRMRTCGYDEAQRPYLVRGFGTALDTIMRRLLPFTPERQGLVTRADTIGAYWKRHPTIASRSRLDLETRDAVVRAHESKSTFRDRMIDEVETYQRTLSEESGKKRENTLSKRQASRMRTYLQREVSRIWL